MRIGFWIDDVILTVCEYGVVILIFVKEEGEGECDEGDGVELVGLVDVEIGI